MINKSPRSSSRHQDVSSSFGIVPGIFPVYEEPALSLLVSASFTEIVREVPHTFRGDIHNAIIRLDSNNCAEHTFLEFQQPCSAASIQPWSDHARHSSLIGSCPPAVARVRDLGIDHQLAYPQRYPNTLEFGREFNGRAASGQFIRFCSFPVYHCVPEPKCTSYLFVTLFRCFRQP